MLSNPPEGWTPDGWTPPAPSEESGISGLEFDRAHKDLFSGIRTRYLVSLAAGDDLLGFIAMGDPVKYRSLSLEEKDILVTIAEQVAAGLMNLKLSSLYIRGIFKSLIGIC